MSEQEDVVFFLPNMPFQVVYYYAAHVLKAFFCGGFKCTTW